MSVRLTKNATAASLCRTYDTACLLACLLLRKRPEHISPHRAWCYKWRVMADDGTDGEDRVVQVTDSAVRNELAQLRQEHRDLDSAIEALQSQASPDNLQIQRLKKRKLVLKDRITSLEDKLLPDIIA